MQAKKCCTLCPPLSAPRTKRPDLCIIVFQSLLSASFPNLKNRAWNAVARISNYQVPCRRHLSIYLITYHRPRHLSARTLQLVPNAYLSPVESPFKIMPSNRCCRSDIVLTPRTRWRFLPGREIPGNIFLGERHVGSLDNKVGRLG